MNKENDEINIENELNELPGYIQSIINDCYTFDKKENSNKNEELNNFDSDLENKNINIDNTPTDKENILNNSISKTNENSNDNNKEENIDENYKDFYDDKENDINIENIFNYKNDFFNPKKSDKEDLESKKIIIIKKMNQKMIKIIKSILNQKKVLVKIILGLNYIIFKKIICLILKEV